MLVDGCKVNKVWFRTGYLLWIPAAAVLFLFFSCRQQVNPRQINRGFYYWKSRLTVTDKEKAVLTGLKTTRLYIKFFDVNWNEESGSIQPVAKINFDSLAVQQLLQQNIQFIPVVFITNESLLKIDSAASIILAQKIIQLTADIMLKQQLSPVDEFQLDCDWTVSTKKNYFLLITEVKRLMRADHLSFTDSALLSATIRLHQVKYRGKSGIPEVDKGLLMCYNMGNLKNPVTKNSILDTKELKKYLSGLESYSLPLDIALPLFSWNVYFSNNTYKGIISNISKDELTFACGQWNKNMFTFSKDTVLKNIPFQKNDQLRLEESTQDELLQTATFVADHLPQKKRTVTVIFYHIDELLLYKHPQHELETLFHCFD